MSEPIKLLALVPNAGKRKTPEEMLIDLFWTRFWHGDSARLLLVKPGSWSDATTVIDDTDLSPWQDKWSAEENGWSHQVFQAPLPPEDWKPTEDSVADLKGMIDDGWIPVGVISDYDSHHHLFPPSYHRSGYLPEEQTRWILYAFLLGYRAAEDRRREEEAALKGRKRG